MSIHHSLVSFLNVHIALRKFSFSFLNDERFEMNLPFFAGSFF